MKTLKALLFLFAVLFVAQPLFAADEERNSGTLKHYVYEVNANQSDLMALVVNEEKGYAMVLQKFVDGNGVVQTAKFCQGNEKFCKSITNGKVCDTSAAPPTDWCFLEGMEVNDDLVADDLVRKVPAEQMKKIDASQMEKKAELKMELLK